MLLLQGNQDAINIQAAKMQINGNIMSDGDVNFNGPTYNFSANIKQREV